MADGQSRLLDANNLKYIYRSKLRPYIVPSPVDMESPQELLENCRTIESWKTYLAEYVANANAITKKRGHAQGPLGPKDMRNLHARTRYRARVGPKPVKGNSNGTEGDWTHSGESDSVSGLGTGLRSGSGSDRAQPEAGPSTGLHRGINGRSSIEGSAPAKTKKGKGRESRAQADRRMRSEGPERDPWRSDGSGGSISSLPSNPYGSDNRLIIRGSTKPRPFPMDSGGEEIRADRPVNSVSEPLTASLALAYAVDDDEEARDIQRAIELSQKQTVLDARKNAGSSGATSLGSSSGRLRGREGLVNRSPYAGVTDEILRRHFPGFIGREEPASASNLASCVVEPPHVVEPPQAPSAPRPTVTVAGRGRIPSHNNARVGPATPPRQGLSAPAAGGGQGPLHVPIAIEPPHQGVQTQLERNRAAFRLRRGLGRGRASTQPNGEFEELPVDDAFLLGVPGATVARDAHGKLLPLPVYEEDEQEADVIDLTAQARSVERHNKKVQRALRTHKAVLTNAARLNEISPATGSIPTPPPPPRDSATASGTAAVASIASQEPHEAISSQQPGAMVARSASSTATCPSRAAAGTPAQGAPVQGDTASALTFGTADAPPAYESSRFGRGPRGEVVPNLGGTSERPARAGAQADDRLEIDVDSPSGMPIVPVGGFGAVAQALALARAGGLTASSATTGPMEVDARDGETDSHQSEAQARGANADHRGPVDQGELGEGHAVNLHPLLTQVLTGDATILGGEGWLPEEGVPHEPLRTQRSPALVIAGPSNILDGTREASPAQETRCTRPDEAIGPIRMDPVVNNGDPVVNNGIPAANTEPMGPSRKRPRLSPPVSCAAPKKGRTPNLKSDQAMARRSRAILARAQNAIEEEAMLDRERLEMAAAELDIPR